MDNGNFNAIYFLCLKFICNDDNNAEENETLLLESTKLARKQSLFKEFRSILSLLGLLDKLSNIQKSLILELEEQIFLTKLLVDIVNNNGVENLINKVSPDLQTDDPEKDFTFRTTFDQWINSKQYNTKQSTRIIECLRNEVFTYKRNLDPYLLKDIMVFLYLLLKIGRENHLNLSSQYMIAYYPKQHWLSHTFLRGIVSELIDEVATNYNIRRTILQKDEFFPHVLTKLSEIILDGYEDDEISTNLLHRNVERYCNGSIPTLTDCLEYYLHLNEDQNRDPPSMMPTSIYPTNRKNYRGQTYLETEISYNLFKNKIIDYLYTGKETTSLPDQDRALSIANRYKAFEKLGEIYYELGDAYESELDEAMKKHDKVSKHMLNYLLEKPERYGHLLELAPRHNKMMMRILLGNRKEDILRYISYKDRRLQSNSILDDTEKIQLSMAWMTQLKLKNYRDTAIYLDVLKRQESSKKENAKYSLKKIYQSMGNLCLKAYNIRKADKPQEFNETIDEDLDIHDKEREIHLLRDLDRRYYDGQLFLDIEGLLDDNNLKDKNYNIIASRITQLEGYRKEDDINTSNEELDEDPGAYFHFGNDERETAENFGSKKLSEDVRIALGIFMMLDVSIQERIDYYSGESNVPQPGSFSKNSDLDPSIDQKLLKEAYATLLTRDSLFEEITIASYDIAQVKSTCFMKTVYYYFHMDKLEEKTITVDDLSERAFHFRLREHRKRYPKLFCRLDKRMAKEILKTISSKLMSSNGEPEAEWVDKVLTCFNEASG